MKLNKLMMKNISLSILFLCSFLSNMIAQNEEIANKIVDKLTKNGIGTRPFFWCMHEQPVFLKKGLFLNEKYPNAEKIARCGFYIPSGLGLTNEDVDQVISTIDEILMKLNEE
jgi:perosamine synthetase